MADIKISALPTDTAPDVADLVPFVDVTASRTEAVTVANLAASTAFSGTYAPVGTSIFVPANLMTSTAGSPTLSGDNTRGVVWLLDASSAENVGFTLGPFPTSWTTYDVKLWWSNAGAGAGDCAFLWIEDFLADGATASYTFVSTTIATAPLVNVIEVTTLASSRSVTAGEILIARLDRAATNGSDTLANDCRIYGIQFVRAS